MRLERLDLNLLVALDALLQERGVSLAADRLNLSQSATSGALARLRAYFNDDLLVLDGRSMALTPRAEKLAAPVRSVLQQIRATIIVAEVIRLLAPCRFALRNLEDLPSRKLHAATDTSID